MADNRPWYREPLVWLLIAFPLIAVVAGFATYYLAYTTSDGLVVDDYYQKGKEINKSLARDHAALQYGLSAKLRHDEAMHEVIVDLTTSTGRVLPKQLDLRWLHATRSGFDKNQPLIRTSDGSYRATIPELAPGHWYVQLEAQDWRLQGSLHVPGEIQIDLNPAE